MPARDTATSGQALPTAKEFAEACRQSRRALIPPNAAAAIWRVSVSASFAAKRAVDLMGAAASFSATKREGMRRRIQSFELLIIINCWNSHQVLSTNPIQKATCHLWGSVSSPILLNTIRSMRKVHGKACDRRESSTYSTQPIGQSLTEWSLLGC